MTTQQPEALRLADALEEEVKCYPQNSDDEPGGYYSEIDQTMDFAASKLRRLHTESEQHLQELAAYRFTVENLQARVAELEAQQAAAPQAVQAGLPVGWMNADTLRAMQDTPKSKKTRWPLYTIGEYTSKEGMIPVYAAAPAHPAEGVPAQAVELEVDDLIDRLLDAQQDLNLAANVHMDQSIASASTLLDKVEIALRTLSATHPTQQGLEQDASRYRVLVESGNFAPSPFDNGMWGLRASSAPSTKSELDAAVDRVLAAQSKQGGTA